MYPIVQELALLETLLRLAEQKIPSFGMCGKARLLLYEKAGGDVRFKKN